MPENAAGIAPLAREQAPSPGEPGERLSLAQWLSTWQPLESGWQVDAARASREVLQPLIESGAGPDAPAATTPGDQT